MSLKQKEIIIKKDYIYTDKKMSIFRFSISFKRILSMIGLGLGVS